MPDFDIGTHGVWHQLPLPASERRSRGPGRNPYTPYSVPTLKPLPVPPPAVVAWLGYGGLVPFVVLGMATMVPGAPARFICQALLAYGAVILSFVGALHWGFAMTSPDVDATRRNGLFLWSVIPALLGWVALLLSSLVAAVLLIVGFIAQYRMDRRLTPEVQLPPWYLALRLRLTIAACCSIAVGILSARLDFTPMSTAVLRASPAQAATTIADASPAPSAATIADASSAPAATTFPGASPAPAPAYRQGHPSIDGIGKFYQGREIAHVMGFEGAEWLERSDRAQEERPDILVEQLQLEPGMTIADIGAGSGYLSRRIAPRVAPAKVYAVDVQPEMVDLLNKLAAQSGMSNIVPIQSSATDVNLPPGSVDLAVLVDVYHELEFPYEVMRSLVRALKPRGRVAFVEYRLEDHSVPIKALHRMSETQVRREMAVLPLVWDHTSERLPIQHIIVFRKR